MKNGLKRTKSGLITSLEMTKSESADCGLASHSE